MKFNILQIIAAVALAQSVTAKPLSVPQNVSILSYFMKLPRILLTYKEAEEAK